MAPISTASIAFGLVNVPVRIYTATESHDIRFHMVHASDGGRIQYDRVCTVCSKSVPFIDIDRAYESPDGHRVIVTDEDLARLPAAEKSEIEVLQFVPADQLDPILLHKSYYLEPAAATPRAYVLLAKTLAKIDRVAIVHFTLRQKTRLAALRVRAGVLVLQTLLWPDEIRAATFPALRGVDKPGSVEIGMAQTLVDALAGDFDPDEHADDYQLELKRMLNEAIAAGGHKVTVAAAYDRQDREVDDLVAALQRSIDSATESQ